MKCESCFDIGWVCEAHANKPWIGDGSCSCGAPGMPCPRCSPSDATASPERPPDVSKVFSGVSRAGAQRFRIVK